MSGRKVAGARDLQLECAQTLAWTIACTYSYVWKCLDERVDEGVLRWYGHLERMERDKIAKRVNVGECNGSHSLGRLWKSWNDIMKECLKKWCLDVRHARRMVQDKSEWWKFVRGNAWGVPLTLTRCHSCRLPQLYEALEGWRSYCGQAYDLKGIKGKFSVFLLFLKFCFSFTLAHFLAWCVLTLQWLFCFLLLLKFLNKCLLILFHIISHFS